MSTAQLRKIYAMARNMGMDNDTLHDVARGISGKDSLKALTVSQAARLIDRLKAYAGESGDIPNRTTRNQRWLIQRIAEEMGWGAEPARLRGMVQRVAGVSDVKFLTAQQAWKVIEALKAMQEGGRGERRQADERLDERDHL